MEAQTFLELVEVMLEVQQDYFQAKRTGLLKAKDLLIQAKELERRVRAVVKEGRLEPDPLPALPQIDEHDLWEWKTTVVSAYEERQLRLHLEDERDAGEADHMEEDDEDEEISN